jgi:hypothetical protein
VGGDVFPAVVGGAAGGVAAAGTTIVIAVGSWAAAVAMSSSNPNSGLVGIGGTIAGLGAGVVVGALTTSGVTSLLSAE